MIVTPDINWLAVLPEIVLALGAAVVLLVEVQWKPAKSVLGTIVAGTLVVAAAFTVLQWDFASDTLRAGLIGDFLAFSGMVVVDGYAVFGRLVLLAATALGILAGWDYIESLARRSAEGLALILLATAGFSIMVASNNLVMMFLGLEVGSIALYVIAGLSRERGRSDEAAIKYFLLGSFASAIFVYGVALLYAGTGALTITGVSEYLNRFVTFSPGVIRVGLGLMIVGLGFKVSAVPFHSWAPDVYQGAPGGVVGYMAAMAKIAGFMALARILITGTSSLNDVWAPLLAIIAALSMLLGSVLALAQSDVRRLLAYSGVAHAGFIMTGVAAGSTSGILFYIAVYALQLVGAFAVVSVVSGSANTGSPLDAYRGLGKRSPVLAGAMTVLLLGMGGLPVTSGFIAKFGVFAEAWSKGFEWLVVVGVLASVIAFAFYLKVIVAMYMDETTESELSIPGTVRWVLLTAVVATIIWGVMPGSLLSAAADALPF